MNDINPQTARVAFDWTSKVMVALYATVTTATLIVVGYFVVRGTRRRARLTNRPKAKAPTPMVAIEVDPDATAAS